MGADKFTGNYSLFIKSGEETSDSRQVNTLTMRSSSPDMFMCWSRTIQNRILNL